MTDVNEMCVCARSRVSGNLSRTDDSGTWAFSWYDKVVKGTY